MKEFMPYATYVGYAIATLLVCAMVFVHKKTNGEWFNWKVIACGMAASVGCLIVAIAAPFWVPTGTVEQHLGLFYLSMVCLLLSIVGLIFFGGAIAIKAK
jgi:Na+/H+-translocating membrane pyrophosphatase